MHLDRQSKMIDLHLHYTGSMPRQYVFHKLITSEPKILYSNNIKSLKDFNDWIYSKFTNDYTQNQKAFNEIYNLFQKATKPNNSIRETYKKDTYTLSMWLNSYSIKKYNIIAGPCNSINATYDRLLGMIEGFEAAEKENKNSFGKITITFIRNKNGDITNCHKEQINDICKILQDPYFKKRCSGFDISGYEYPDTALLDKSLELLKYIQEISKQNNLAINTGLHAGEILTNTLEDEIYNDFFIKLLKLKPNNIGHGTFLWSNPNKENILKNFSYGCRFDICPCSNKILTPIQNPYIHLKRLKQLKIQYCLCRDDPSIFNNWILP